MIRLIYTVAVEGASPKERATVVQADPARPDPESIRRGKDHSGCPLEFVRTVSKMHGMPYRSRD